MSYLHAVIAAAAALFLWGCAASSLPSIFPTNAKIIIAKPNPPMYARVEEKGLGDSIGVAPFTRGDTVQAYARLTEPGYGVYYLVFNGSDSIWLRYGFDGTNGDVMTEYDYEVALQPTAFQLPKEQDSLVWSRAIRFIKGRWGLSIRSSSDYRMDRVSLSPFGSKVIVWEKQVIESEPPDSGSVPGFRVTKMVLGDSIYYKCESFFNRKLVERPGPIELSGCGLGKGKKIMIRAQSNWPAIC